MYGPNGISGTFAPNGRDGTAPGVAAPLLLLAVALAGNPLTSDPEIKSGLGLLEKLEYDRAVVVLGRALTRSDLPKVDRVAGLEALAFAYTILDDRVHADETFCELLDVYPEYRIVPSRSPRLRDAFARAKALWTRGREVAFTLDPRAPDLAGTLSGDPRRLGAVRARSDDGELLPLACDGATCRGPRPRARFRVELEDHAGTLLATAGPFDGDDRRSDTAWPWWAWVAVGVGAVGLGAVVVGVASPGEPPDGTLGTMRLP